MNKSAKHEVLLVLPTINAFYREECIGIIELLRQAAERKDNTVNVKILTPRNDIIEKKILAINTPNIDIASYEEQEELQLEAEKITITTVTIVIVDKKESLVIEKTDDSKQNFIEAVGIATYSNSKPTVLSYISIFENLWRQTELYQQVKESNKQLELAYEQLKISDKMQSEFISAAAHELRTPIQPIISSVGIIRSRMGNMKVQGLDYSLDMIARNAERLSQLSSDILDVTKIEGNSLELQNEQLDLNKVLLNTVEKYKKQITKANIDIQIFFEPHQ